MTTPDTSSAREIILDGSDWVIEYYRDTTCRGDGAETAYWGGEYEELVALIGAPDPPDLEWAPLPLDGAPTDHATRTGMYDRW